MKRFFAAVCVLCLLGPCALADINNDVFLTLPDMLVYTESHSVNTVYRSTRQPFFGQADGDVMDVCAYLDYLQMPNEHATVIRLTLSLATPDPLSAKEVRVTEGGKTYVFTPGRAVAEYDMMYYEDYFLYLTDDSLPMLKSMARSKDDSHTFTICGESTVTCTVIMPGDQLADLYDQYVNAGGLTQSFTVLRDLWPVTITKK